MFLFFGSLISISRLFLFYIFVVLDLGFAYMIYYTVRWNFSSSPDGEDANKKKRDSNVEKF